MRYIILSPKYQPGCVTALCVQWTLGEDGQSKFTNLIYLGERGKQQTWNQCRVSWLDTAKISAWDIWQVQDFAFFCAIWNYFSFRPYLSPYLDQRWVKGKSEQSNVSEQFRRTMDALKYFSSVLGSSNSVNPDAYFHNTNNTHLLLMNWIKCCNSFFYCTLKLYTSCTPHLMYLEENKTIFVKATTLRKFPLKFVNILFVLSFCIWPTN